MRETKTWTYNNRPKRDVRQFCFPISILAKKYPLLRGYVTLIKLSVLGCKIRCCIYNEFQSA